MKSLIMRNPELIPTLSQRMMEFRGQFVDLASERTATREQAELAVSLIMAALGRLMHVDEVESSDAPLSDRLRQSVRELVDVNALPLLPGGARS
jgi:hypothetical protein